MQRLWMESTSRQNQMFSNGAAVLSWQMFCRFSRDPLNKSCWWLSAPRAAFPWSHLEDGKRFAWLELARSAGTVRALIETNANGLIIATHLLYWREGKKCWCLHISSYYWNVDRYWHCSTTFKMRRLLSLWRARSSNYCITHSHWEIYSERTNVLWFKNENSESKIKKVHIL